MKRPEHEDRLRCAAEALLPDIEAMSHQEVAACLQAAGADPQELARRAAALPSVSPARERRAQAWRWAAVAAACAVVVALGIWAGRAGLLPGQNQTLASVAAGAAPLYLVQTAGVHPLAAGATLATGQEVRAGAVPGAQLRLARGTQIEMGARADVILSRGWNGTTVHLLRGQLIVHAAPQSWARRLHIATADSQVTDQGTIFSVSHSLMGSRVAVVQGQVGFRYMLGGSEREVTLGAGQQASSNARLSQASWPQELGWSDHAAQYLAMLGALRSMGAQLAALPGPAPRYHSDLTNLVPPGAVLYAAIPNPGQTLGQAQQILQSELSQSPELQAWWKQTGPNGAPSRGEALQSTLNSLQQMTAYLGDEIAVAAVSGPTASARGVVVLAAVSKPGLAQFLQSQPAASGQAPLRVVTDPAAAGSGRQRSLLVWIGANRLVATHNGTLLQAAAALATRLAPGPFLSSPLYQQVAPLYQAGASWILAVDLNQLHSTHVSGTMASRSQPAFLVARSQLRDAGGATDIRLSFSGPRSGAAALLGAPGSMGGLSFISPQATLAASVITESPAAIAAWRQSHAHAPGSGNPRNQALRADLQNLAAPLGGEFTFALDGPVVPKPAWKLAIEVNDSLAMQSAIEQLLHDAAQGSSPAPTLHPQTLAGRTYYVLSGKNGAAFAYTYAGGYLVAGSDLTEVQNAMATQESGTGLPFSSQFESMLPSGGSANFSLLVYHHLDPALAQAVAGVLPSSSKNLQPAISALVANSQPGIFYGIAQPDALELASTRGLLGFTLQDLLGFGLRAQAHAAPLH